MTSKYLFLMGDFNLRQAKIDNINAALEVMTPNNFRDHRKTVLIFDGELIATYRHEEAFDDFS